MPKSESIWTLYMIRCAKGQLYTGITTDVQRRLEQHQSGKGAKFLRGKSPLALVFQQLIGSRSLATKVEIATKKLSKQDKEHSILEPTYFKTKINF